MERQDVMLCQTEEPTGDEQVFTRSLERLAATAAMLEQAVDRLTERQSTLEQSAETSIGRLVATVEARREGELEHKLAAAEAELALLRAQALSASAVPATPTNGRKTVPLAMANLLAKQGVTVDSMEAGALDTALNSLSIEQRIAVKAQLMRAGLLT